MEITKGARELVFIDASIHEHELIRGGLRQGVKAVTIHANENGIERITQSLATESNLKAVHIISHGKPGSLRLGSSHLSLDTLEASFASIQAWTNALVKGSELLLYGCSVGAGQRGASFVNTLSSWLGIHVAASTQRVGAAQCGGSWNFNYLTGPIFTENAIQPETRQVYQGAFPDNLLYASDGAGNLYTVNTANGVSQLFGPPNSVPSTFALARDAETGLLFTIGNGTSSGLVSTFNPVTQTSAVVGPTGLGGTFFKLAQADDGRLFGIRGNNAVLSVFNRVTGEGNDLGTIANLPVGSGDMAFNPLNPNQLIILVTQSNPSDIYALYSVDISDLSNLNATLLGNIVNQAGNALTPGAGSGTLAFGPDGNLYVTSRDNGTTAATNDALFQIPVTNGAIPTGTITANFVAALQDGNGQAITVTDFATLPTPTVPPGSLAVDISIDDGLTNVDPNQSITYTITVSNPNSVAVPVQIQDFLPPSILQNPTFTVNIPVTSGSLIDPADVGSNIPVTADTTIEALVVSGQSFTISLTGTVDPNALNNTSIETSATATIVEDFVDLNNIVPRTPLVTDTDIDNDTVVDRGGGGGGVDRVDVAVVTNTDQLATVNPGDDVTYTVRITNNSNIPVQGIHIENPIPRQIRQATYEVSIPAGTGSLENPSDATGSGDIDIVANLDAGATATITIRGRVANGASIGDIILNTATATVPNGVTDVDLSNNERTDRTRIVEGDDGGGGHTCADGEKLDGSDGKDLLRGTGGIDEITGFDGDDVLRGLGCPDTIFGGRGADALFGNEARDLLRGNQGNDDIRGGKGPDQINGGLGADFVKAGSQDDRVRGRLGDDVINGNQGDDRIRGDDGNDIVQGNSGRDRVFGGLGDDVTRGGGGADFVQAGPGNDVAAGGAGNDLIIAGLGDDEVFGNSGDDQVFGRRGDDTINAGFGNDIAIGGLGDDEVRGSRGDDVLNGSENDDKVIAGPGNDFARGGVGNDIVRGNNGDDVMIMGRGNDSGFGGSDNDLIWGEEGDDIVGGNGGSDIVSGGFGNDKVRGGGGNDTVQGNQGNDRINGNRGDDSVNGGLGDDIVRGGAGQDFLRGDRGNDIIRGGADADIIVGGLGNDDLAGGGGADIFVYQNVAANTSQASRFVDSIRDFDVTSDRIDLSAIFDSPRFSGTNPLDIVRVRGFRDTSSVVQIDLNGGQPDRNFRNFIILHDVLAETVSNDIFIT
ncbi:MAG: DUF4347 domain-containing protein [Leptolyngbyaceae bacterium]|nr:DUF4347 domain-containing protein [Leptolyngbyaceae bacterium]